MHSFYKIIYVDYLIHNFEFDYTSFSGIQYAQSTQAVNIFGTFSGLEL